MSGSLLAYLYPRIKGSQEDIATYSLCYIVDRSEALRAELTRLFTQRLNIECNEMLHFSSQVIGDQKDRPDIVGFDSTGRERVICEAKFFAALTDNQPNGYLQRLAATPNSGLIFLCPRSRLTGLWKRLCHLTADCFTETISDVTMRLKQANMAIMTWDELLDSLLLAVDRHAPEMKDDLMQLVGFCSQIESSTFVPFKEEDFGIDVAKRIDRYNLVVDTATEILLSQHKHAASTKGYRATSVWSGYVRYMDIDGISLGLWTHRGLRKRSTSLETPFWANLTWRGWTRDQVRTAFYDSLLPQMTETDSTGESFIALEAPVGLTLDETAQSIADQVLKLVEQMLDFRKRYNATD